MKYKSVILLITLSCCSIPRSNPVNDRYKTLSKVEVFEVSHKLYFRSGLNAQEVINYAKEYGYSYQLKDSLVLKELQLLIFSDNSIKKILNGKKRRRDFIDVRTALILYFDNKIITIGYNKYLPFIQVEHGMYHVNQELIGSIENILKKQRSAEHKGR